MNVIPAIDLQNGRCVRLFQGDFSRETEYSTDPVSVAQQFQEAGFQRLHVVDLDGARSGKQAHHELVQEIARQTDLEIQLGGGIRTSASIAHWLQLGVKRCVIGSVAVHDPAEVKRWLATFGADRIVLALDIRFDEQGTPCLATDGWTRTSALTLWDCVDNYGAAGASHVLCTDISRDGAMTGPSVRLYREFVSRYPDIQLQASGGVRNDADLQALAALGAHAAITGRALLDGNITMTGTVPCRHDA